MTKEEAIKYFRNAKGLSSTFDKAADLAIEALSVECNDCIWSVCNYNKVDWDGEGGDTE